MFRNYFTVALRHLNRQKGYSLINVTSLALGIACCLLIVLFIRDELSYDRFHDKADRIYRVTAEHRQGDQVSLNADVLIPIAKFIRADFPEVEDMVRFVPPGNAWMVKYGDKGFYERDFYLADSSVFNVFHVPLVTGNPRTALDGNDKIVLSETIARKYFGDENPIGKILDAEGSFHLVVTGVMEDLPSNSHLGFDILASFRIQEAYTEVPLDEFGWRASYSYLLLREGTDPAELEAKLPAFVDKYLGDRYGNEEESLTLRLQPLTDIHLHSHLEREITPNSDIAYVYLFTAIAVFIIVIACINFMNLATARSAGRAREIGLRKVFGAGRGQVMRQFISESMIMSGLAVCVALVLAIVSLPWFNLLTGKSLAMDADTVWFALGAVVAIGVVVGFVAGSYPSLYLSGLAPIQTLKGSLGTSNAGMRRILVVGQFAISIALLICTGVVFNQVEYIRAKNMGLNTDQVVAVPLTFLPVMETSPVFKARIMESPHVVKATLAYILPGHKNAVIPLSVSRPEDSFASKYDMHAAWTDEDYIDLFGIELVAGRYFDRTFPGDWTGTGAVVMNEAAAARLGFDPAEAAVGETILWLHERRLGYEEDKPVPREVVGVMKDFHFRSLHEPIEPLVLFPDREGGHAMVKIDSGNLMEALAFIEDTWNEVNPDFAFEYFFVEDTFARLYDAEQRFGRIFVSFAALAVVIACLGLFGLSSFTAERRTKEIGVRKVLGASIPNLFGMLSSEFVRLVIVANVLAWPVAYAAMNSWLGGFAYRVDLGWTTFILAGVLAMAIALLTVGFQAVRAATANPVESLRTE
ncbi:MAG: FtsX-like permease family protein [Gemmatimonadetes bacterium]|nr:FtsX-like permease family protein [Gemmatimonadota bacterium]MYG84490.1 FtsX-like permease family protein [Gemmatimonadota bacterium]MYJ89891.1 FtsX-like permease family protein [Gemmatimonadota bacterium]